MGCTLGYVGVTPRKRLRACVAVHLLGSISHTTGGARHGTGALCKLAPPEGYSTSIHVVLWSCNPSLRVRLRRDARADDARSDASADALADARAGTHADALADALANTPDDTRADAHACALADARAHHRRAGRCAVGYALL
jgi:hypothetical protein